MKIARVALDLPLDETFDFLLGETSPVIGSLVIVPFGNRMVSMSTLTMRPEYTRRLDIRDPFLGSVTRHFLPCRKS